ncbi:hypothetical protein CW304_12815 [Bacillus sp. UFRGS-B20]|nr:hypothetical protein CW304_12815 [Bacillus sp. UFRGS-B20]
MNIEIFTRSSPSNMLSQLIPHIHKYYNSCVRICVRIQHMSPHLKNSHVFFFFPEYSTLWSNGATFTSVHNNSNANSKHVLDNKVDSVSTPHFST